MGEELPPIKIDTALVVRASGAIAGRIAMKRFVLGGLFLVACGKSGSPPQIATYDGTVTIGGKPAKITSCKAEIGTYEQATFPIILLGLDTGDTIAIDPILGSAIRGKDGTTTKLSDCSRTSYEGGTGGVAPGGRVWDIGKAALTCTTPAGELVLDVTYDCGSKERPSNLKQ